MTQKDEDKEKKKKEDNPPKKELINKKIYFLKFSKFLKIS